MAINFTYYTPTQWNNVFNDYKIINMANTPNISIPTLNFTDNWNNLFTNYKTTFTTKFEMPSYNIVDFKTINANFEKLNASMQNIGKLLDTKVKNIALPKIDTSLLKFDSKIRTATQGLGKVPKSNLQNKIATITNELIKETNNVLNNNIDLPVITEIKNTEYASTSALNTINKWIDQAKTKEEKQVIQSAIETNKSMGTNAISTIKETANNIKSATKLQVSNEIQNAIVKSTNMNNDADKVLLEKLINVRLTPTEKNKITINDAYLETLSARNDVAGIALQGLTKDYVEPWKNTGVENAPGEFMKFDTPDQPKKYLVYKQSTMTTDTWNYLVKNKFVSDTEKKSGEMIASKIVDGKTAFQTLIEYKKLNPTTETPLPELTTAPMGGTGTDYTKKAGILVNTAFSTPSIAKFEQKFNPNEYYRITDISYSIKEGQKLGTIEINGKKIETSKQGISSTTLVKGDILNNISNADTTIWKIVEQGTSLGEHYRINEIDPVTNTLVAHEVSSQTYGGESKQPTKSTGLTEAQQYALKYTGKTDVIPAVPKSETASMDIAKTTIQQPQTQKSIFAGTQSMIGAQGTLLKQLASQQQIATTEKIIKTSTETIQKPATGLKGLLATKIVQENPTIAGVIDQLRQVFITTERAMEEQGYTIAVEVKGETGFSVAKPFTTLYRAAEIYANEGVVDFDRAWETTTENKLTDKGITLVKETAPLIAMGVKNIGYNYGVTDAAINKAILESSDTGSLQVIAMSNPKWVALQAYDPRTSALALDAYGVEGIKKAQSQYTLTQEDISGVGLSILGGTAKAVINTEVTGIPGIDNALIPLTLGIDALSGAKGLNQFRKDVMTLMKTAEPFGKVGNIYDTAKTTLNIDYKAIFNAAKTDNKLLSESLGDLVGNALIGNTKISGITSVDVPTVFKLAATNENPLISKNALNVIGKETKFDSSKTAQKLYDLVGQTAKTPGETYATIILPTDVRNVIANGISASDNPVFEASVLQKFNDLTNAKREPVLPTIKISTDVDEPTRITYGTLPTLQVNANDGELITKSITESRTIQLSEKQATSLKKYEQSNDVYKVNNVGYVKVESVNGNLAKVRLASTDEIKTATKKYNSYMNENYMGTAKTTDVDNDIKNTIKAIEDVRAKPKTETSTKLESKLSQQLKDLSVGVKNEDSYLSDFAKPGEIDIVDSPRTITLGQTTWNMEDMSSWKTPKFTKEMETATKEAQNRGFRFSLTKNEVMNSVMEPEVKNALISNYGNLLADAPETQTITKNVDVITPVKTQALPQMTIGTITPNTKTIPIQQALNAAKNADYAKAAEYMKTVKTAELKKASNFVADTPMTAISQMRTANVPESTVKALETQRKTYAILELDKKGLSESLVKLEKGNTLSTEELNKLYENRDLVKDALFKDVKTRDATNKKIFNAKAEQLMFSGTTEEKAAFRLDIEKEIEKCKAAGICK